MDLKQFLMEKYGLELPQVPVPVALYKPVRRSGNLLYLSGQTANINGTLYYAGVLGKDLSIEEGKKSAQLAGLNLLAVLYDYLDGNLDRVSQVVQMTGYIRSAENFGSQPAVMNGVSELFYEVFGEKGIASRAALGTNELPSGASVEVLAIVEVTD